VGSVDRCSPLEDKQGQMQVLLVLLMRVAEGDQAVGDEKSRSGGDNRPAHMSGLSLQRYRWGTRRMRISPRQSSRGAVQKLWKGTRGGVETRWHHGRQKGTKKAIRGGSNVTNDGSRLLEWG